MTTIPTNVSTANAVYPIKLHTDGIEAKAGNRLSIIRFKQSKTDKNKPKPKPPTYYCEIPEVEIAVEPEELIKPLTAAFCDLQDSIIREKVEALIAGDNSCNQITASEISTVAVSFYFDKIAASGRLSTEGIEDWFDNQLAEQLASALLAAKPELANAPDTLAAALAGHKKHIASLASPRANMPVALATQLKRAVVLADETNNKKLKETLASKLDAFINPPKVTELDFGL